MMQKLQRFGAAMFTPVLLFSFAGIMTAVCILMTNQQNFWFISSTDNNLVWCLEYIASGSLYSL